LKLESRETRKTKRDSINITCRRATRQEDFD
jgi:hypothetical protein